ncbi:MAG: lipoate--protein ligase family protein [Bacteroidetes bacterium]|nr:lipoate--protein ligase family protein [Bacteroidota bacterium]
MNWRFENTGIRSGVFNMEYDINLAQELARGAGNPTIRVYAWQPSAISLGWNQSMDEIDLAKTSVHGIDVVKRPTGGRAVLHSEELTYCVIMHSCGKNIHEVYDDISRALVAGLSKLGVTAAIEKSQPDFPSLYKTSSAAACFSSTGRYEIKCSGKKLVGSAQRRYAAGNGEEIVLQHGSILTGPGHKKIIDYINFHSEKERSILRKELDEKTTDLSEVLNRAVSYEEVAESVLEGFRTSRLIRPESAGEISRE